MREIKFRVWDTTTGHWYEGLDLILHTSGRLIHMHPSLVLQQYTGLKDTSGKEIYEGDIVNYEYNNPTGWHKLQRVVEWNEKVAGFEVPTEAIFTRNIEIVGNMYEDPELMEAKS
jgi:hypothetical protein